MPCRIRSSGGARSIASRGPNEMRLVCHENIVSDSNKLYVINKPVNQERSDRRAVPGTHPGCFHRVFATPRTAFLEKTS